MNRVLPVLQPSRPITRGECEKAPRPCPWVSCRYHLWTERLLSSSENIFDMWQEDTCALDIAANGPHTLEETGRAVGLTRERARQIEVTAIKKASRLKLSVIRSLELEDE